MFKLKKNKNKKHKTSKEFDFLRIFFPEEHVLGLAAATVFSPSSRWNYRHAVCSEIKSNLMQTKITF